MSKTTKFVAVAGTALAVLGIISGSAMSASAADSYTVDNLTSQQRQAISAWESSVSNTSKDARAQSTSAGITGGAAVAASSGGVRTISLYRGSWLMWGQENVQFSYSGNGSTINWSSGWQDAGAVFPNNITRNGTHRYYHSSTLDEWRGQYTVGAGVPTPWGNANVYNATSTAQSVIKNIGSVQWWLN